MSQPSLMPAEHGGTTRSRGHLAALSAAVLIIATTVTALLANPGSASASASGDCAMRGHAYATRVHLGTQVRSGPTANLGLCTSTVGVTRRNQTVGADLPKVLVARAVTSRVVTRHKSPFRAHRITAQTHTARVVLLGQIHARAIVARATASTRRHRRLVGRTVILGLTLHGKNVPEHPKQNQVYALPGLGKLVLNHQVRTRRGNRLTISVTALKLILGAGNRAHLPAGVVTIGHTVASVRLPSHP